MSENFRHRRLPHWEKANATYFITACLAGSIPARGLLTIRQAVDKAVGHRPSQPSAVVGWQQTRVRHAFRCREAWLDNDPGVRWFADSRLARVACEAIRYHAKTRYALYAYVVMPSHMHCVLSPRGAGEVGGASHRVASLSSIMHSLKSFIAHECKKIVEYPGAFWQHESYDRVVRNESELERTIRYVEGNPVKAGLCARPEEWVFSSASERAPLET